jgi:hypothetical protein
MGRNPWNADAHELGLLPASCLERGVEQRKPTDC